MESRFEFFLFSCFCFHDRYVEQRGCPAVSVPTVDLFVRCDFLLVCRSWQFRLARHARLHFGQSSLHVLNKPVQNGVLFFLSAL